MASPTSAGWTAACCGTPISSSLMAGCEVSGLHRHEPGSEQVRHHHVAIGAGLLVERSALAHASVSGSICTWSMKLRFQMGSNSPLANGRPGCSEPAPCQEMIDAENLLLADTSCRRLLSSTALARSVPKGFP